MFSLAWFYICFCWGVFLNNSHSDVILLKAHVSQISAIGNLSSLYFFSFNFAVSPILDCFGLSSSDISDPNYTAAQTHPHLNFYLFEFQILPKLSWKSV